MRSRGPANATAPALAITSPVSAETTPPSRLARVGEPAMLLATRVVHPATALSSQPAPNALSHSVGSAIARSPTGARRSCHGPVSGRATPLCGLTFARLVREWTTRTEKPRASRAFMSTATGIRTRFSAVRGRRPRPLDDSGGGCLRRRAYRPRAPARLRLRSTSRRGAGAGARMPEAVRKSEPDARGPRRTAACTARAYRQTARG